LKAVIYTHYGTTSNLHLTEVPKPTPKDNEVLIRVHASSVNAWDWDILRGKPFLVRVIGGLFKPKNQILGADFAGTIESVGNNVREFKPGDEVFGDFAESGFGGFAEYAAVPEKLLAHKSPKMTFEQAAAIAQAGLLAIQGLRFGGELKANQQILINGAGGGVGTLALQYAKSFGAIVTCVDKSEKFDLLRSLGADHVIDYRTEDYTRTGKQYDLILDVIAHRTVSDYKRALKPGGTFSMIGGSMGGLLIKLMLFGSVISKFNGKKLGVMGYRPNRSDLDLLTRLFEEGKVIPAIDKVYPLHQVPEAMQHLGDGKVRGKIVISVENESLNLKG
jgi:NADPH:quinone reductase-like Zn-dependent oxidoreductase